MMWKVDLFIFPRLMEDTALGKSSAKILASEEPKSSCSSLFGAELFAVLKQEVVSRSPQ